MQLVAESDFRRFFSRNSHKIRQPVEGKYREIRLSVEGKITKLGSRSSENTVKFVDLSHLKKKKQKLSVDRGEKNVKFGDIMWKKTPSSVGHERKKGGERDLSLARKKKWRNLLVDRGGRPAKFFSLLLKKN